MLFLLAVKSQENRYAVGDGSDVAVPSMWSHWGRSVSYERGWWKNPHHMVWGPAVSASDNVSQRWSIFVSTIQPLIYFLHVLHLIGIDFISLYHTCFLWTDGRLRHDTAQCHP